MKAPLRFALAATTALGWITPVLAQTATDASGNDIIVTARRVEERLQDVPISITVFNQEQLANRNIVNAHGSRRPTRRRFRSTTASARRRPPSPSAASSRNSAPRRRSASISPTSSRRAGLRTTPAGNGAGAGHVLRPAERAGAEGPAGHAVRPQHHRRRGAAGAAEADRPARRLCRGLARQLRHAARPGRAQRAAGRHVQGPRSASTGRSATASEERHRHRPARISTTSTTSPCAPASSPI